MTTKIEGDPHLKPREGNTLDALLQMSLNEDAFEQILEILEQQSLRKTAKASKMRTMALPKTTATPSIKRRTIR
jgi:hypothetical protein